MIVSAEYSSHVSSRLTLDEVVLVTNVVLDLVLLDTLLVLVEDIDLDLVLLIALLVVVAEVDLDLVTLDVTG